MIKFKSDVIQSAFCIACFVSALAGLMLCSPTSPENSSTSGKDTLYSTSYHYSDTILYVWQENGLLRTTKESPYRGDTMTEPFVSSHFTRTFVHTPPGIFHFNTGDNRFYDHLVVIRKDSTLYDTIHLSIPPDTLIAFHKSHGPQILFKDSLKALLDTIREGYIFYIDIKATHFPGDSASMRIEDNPSFIKFNDSLSNCCGDFYGSTVSCSFTIDRSDYNYTLSFRPDSTFLGSNYKWCIIAENRFGVKDSLEFKTTIVPYAVWNKSP